MQAIHHVLLNLKKSSRTINARGEQKLGPFSSLFEAMSCDQYFSDFDFVITKV
jgi:hypothetical protein